MQSGQETAELRSTGHPETWRATEITSHAGMMERRAADAATAIPEQPSELN